jgi:hypothetical protein
MDGLPQPAPLLYYDSAQKSQLFFSGAVVGESPHGPAGSCIVYILYTIYNKYDINDLI